MARGNKYRALLVVVLAAMGTAGCGDALSPETGRVRILLTDAPSDIIAEAYVWISRIYVQGPGDEGEEGEGEEPASPGRVDLFNDPENPQMYDLLLLQDGVTADLTGEVEVDATTYNGLRFVVDSTHLVLQEGYHFTDGSTEGGFKVPSGGQSGIKVQLAEGVLDVSEGGVVTVVVDFPVDDNFVIQQDATTGDIRRILFTPTLKQKTEEVEETP